MTVTTIKRLTRFILKLSLTIFALLAFTVIGQASQYIASAKELRTQAITQWEKDNPLSTALSNQFIYHCLKSRKTPSKDALDDALQNKHPLTIYECGENLGAHDLVKKVQAADKQLTTLAWPLSVLE
ncbi:hypothetical protein [Vibrio jasicida]|uniref:hypothetical protein n=1 Tax=Vibrio jasicida TaxID=766224 RepID=UPI0005F064ED|nr:hypothetical protein [Vibrio jasicida]